MLRTLTDLRFTSGTAKLRCVEAEEGEDAVWGRFEGADKDLHVVLLLPHGERVWSTLLGQQLGRSPCFVSKADLTYAGRCVWRQMIVQLLQEGTILASGIQVLCTLGDKQAQVVLRCGGGDGPLASPPRSASPPVNVDQPSMFQRIL